MLSKNEVLKHIEEHLYAALDKDDIKDKRINGFIENIRSKSDVIILNIFKNMTGMQTDEILNRKIRSNK